MVPGTGFNIVRLVAQYRFDLFGQIHAGHENRRVGRGPIRIYAGHENRRVGRGPIRIVSSQDSKISQWFGWLLAHQLDKTLESSVAPSTLFAPYYSYYFYYFDSFHSTLLSKIPRQNKEKEKSSLQGQ